MTYSFYPSDVLPEGFCVGRAANDLLFTEDGREYIDLLGGSGTVLLGHAHPAIAGAIKEQLDKLWCTGVLPARVALDARDAIEYFLPPSQRLAALYSTGMEAVEFALRVARHATGRKAVVGFNGSMHGKSLAAARLGWPNTLASMPDFHSLAYLPEKTEAAILDDVRADLASGSVAAVFLEPLLGSRGGYIPSPAFAGQLAEACVATGTVFVMDEIFTGFYRTGPLFLHQDLGVTPDILLVGKSMGNGFPVSGVAVDRRFAIESKMLPGSTYAGNPLAAAAVVATLHEMRTLPMSEKVAEVEAIIRNSLADLEDSGVALRGKGALWVLEFPRSVNMRGLMSRIIQEGVIPSQTANYIRLLPAATITPAHLSHACDVIRRACHAQLGTAAAVTDRAYP